MKSLRHRPSLAMLCSTRTLRALWQRARTTQSWPDVGVFGMRNPLRSSGFARREYSIEGKSTRSADEQVGDHGKYEQMVFVAFALLGSGPVCEKAVCAVNRENGHQHVRTDTESGYSCKQTDDETETAKELRKDGEHGEGRRDVE